MAFQQPTRQAVLPSLVPQGELMNAIALSNAAMNLARIGGPALAGFLIAWIGIPGAYVAKVMVFALATVMTFVMRFSAVRSATSKGGAMSNFTEGLWRLGHADVSKVQEGVK